LGERTEDFEIWTGGSVFDAKREKCRTEKSISRTAKKKKEKGKERDFFVVRGKKEARLGNTTKKLFT